MEVRGQNPNKITQNAGKNHSNAHSVENLDNKINDTKKTQLKVTSRSSFTSMKSAKNKLIPVNNFSAVLSPNSSFQTTAVDFKPHYFC